MFIYTVMVAYDSDPDYYHPEEAVITSIQAESLVTAYLNQPDVYDAYYEVEQV